MCPRRPLTPRMTCASPTSRQRRGCRASGMCRAAPRRTTSSRSPDRASPRLTTTAMDFPTSTSSTDPRWITCGRRSRVRAPPCSVTLGHGTFRDVTAEAGRGQRTLGTGRLRRRLRQRRRGRHLRHQLRRQPAVSTTSAADSRTSRRRPAWPSTAGRRAVRLATTTATGCSTCMSLAMSHSISITCRRRQPTHQALRRHPTRREAVRARWAWARPTRAARRSARIVASG